MRISIRAFHLDTGEVTPLAPKDLGDYTAWVERGNARGFKALDMGDGIVRFVSSHPDEKVVFTAKAVD